MAMGHSLGLAGEGSVGRREEKEGCNWVGFICLFITGSWFGTSGSKRRYIGVMMLTLTPRYEL